MNDFCKTHVGDRTESELVLRIRMLDVREKTTPGGLTPGLSAERQRAIEELEARGRASDAIRATTIERD